MKFPHLIAITYYLNNTHPLFLKCSIFSSSISLKQYSFFARQSRHRNCTALLLTAFLYIPISSFERDAPQLKQQLKDILQLYNLRFVDSTSVSFYDGIVKILEYAYDFMLETVIKLNAIT